MFGLAVLLALRDKVRQTSGSGIGHHASGFVNLLLAEGSMGSCWCLIVFLTFNNTVWARGPAPSGPCRRPDPLDPRL